MFKELLSTDPKATSAMRAMSFISLFSGIAMGFYGLYAGKDLTGLTMLVSVFVGAAFGGKVWQKSIESKIPAESKPEGS